MRMKGKQFRVKEKSRAAELRETMFASNLVGTLCVCVYVQSSTMFHL